MHSQATMTDHDARRTSVRRRRNADPLLSDESTMELIIKARAGDRMAVEALLQRCLPDLKRWAHGKLPVAARGAIDTGDLVQDAARVALRRLHVFEPRHVGAMQAYLRQSVINRIRDEGPAHHTASSRRGTSRRASRGCHVSPGGRSPDGVVRTLSAGSRLAEAARSRDGGCAG